jgi:DNA-binding response OmpR family regulator
MRKIHVVIVEDNIDLAEEMAFYLEHLEMSVITFQSGKRLDGWLENNICDVLILDLTLPGEDGLSIAKRLSNHKDLRIIMLTSRVMKEDRIAGFEAGADVYLNKPIDFEELASVVYRLARRVADTSIVQKYTWKLNSEFFLMTTPHGKEIKLTKSENSFLKLLSKNSDQYSGREALEEEIWGHSDIYTSRRLDVLVSRLRAKLENPEGITIQTHWSNGYCFIHQIEEV